MKIMKRLKSKWNHFLKNLAKENKKSFGSGSLDCCNIDKDGHKS